MRLAPFPRELPSSGRGSHAHKTTRRETVQLAAQADDVDDEAESRQGAESLQGVGLSARDHADDVDLHAVDRGLEGYQPDSEAPGLPARGPDDRLRFLNRYQCCRWQRAENKRREAGCDRRLSGKSAIHAGGARGPALHRGNDA